jgi:hypothetical protein
MPDGSGRKLIAEQVGAALPGALVAASAGETAKASAKPIAAMIVLCIVLFPLSQNSPFIIRQPTGQEVELTTMNADPSPNRLCERSEAISGR